MYERFYGLTERPFELTPNPRYLFLTPKHQEALGNVLLGIRQRKGLTVTARFPKHAGQTLCVAISPDGKLLAAGTSSGGLQLYDVATQKLAKELRCDDLMPGCNRLIEGRDEKEVLAKAAEHARNDHNRKRPGCSQGKPGLFVPRALTTKDTIPRNKSG